MVKIFEDMQMGFLVQMDEDGGSSNTVRQLDSDKWFLAYTTLGVWVASRRCGRASDLRSRGRGFKSRPGMRRKNLGQVSHTYVPVSLSSISWYWLKGSDARRLGR